MQYRYSTMHYHYATAAVDHSNTTIRLFYQPLIQLPETAK